MDGIGLPGGIFILTLMGAWAAMLVIALWAAVDVYLHRDTMRYPWVLIAGLVVAAPFVVGGLVGVLYLISKRREGPATPPQHTR